MNINADGADPKTSIRKDLIRDELLQHAAGLFAGRGYANTSMQDIAQAVGLSRSAVYHYFSNKEDVLRALLDGSTAAAMEHLTRLRNETSLSAAERLREAVRSNVTRRLKDGPARRALEYVDAEMPKELLAQFNKIRRRILQFHIDIIEEGIRQKEFRPVDSKVAAFAIIGMCNWTSWWYSPSGSQSPEQIAEILAELALCSVRRDSARAPAASLAGAVRRLKDDLAELERLAQPGNGERGA